MHEKVPSTYISKTLTFIFCVSSLHIETIVLNASLNHSHVSTTSLPSPPIRFNHKRIVSINDSNDIKSKSRKGWT